MAPLLVLCLLSPLLVASADPPALKCLQGAKGKEVLAECPSGLDACMVIKDESTMLGTEFNTTFYTCGKKESCANAFNITIEKEKHLRSSSACCVEEGCNAKLVWNSPTALWAENKLTCPSGCYAQKETECTDNKVSCTDGQRSCIHATGSSGAKTFVLKGCGTSNMCNVENYEVTIGGIPYKISKILCDTEAVASNP